MRRFLITVLLRYGIEKREMGSSREGTKRRLSSFFQTPTPYSLAWKHLSYQVPVRQLPTWKKTRPTRPVLNDVSGLLRSGQSLAIIGSHGSGKSTLLAILAGRGLSDHIGGEIFKNGKSRGGIKFIARNDKDAFHTVLSVKETLTFTAHLTCASKSERSQLIQSVTEALDLEEAVATRISKLSDCQARQLSIAIALLSRPSVLLLDDPFEGLGATCVLLLMDYLSDLVSIGHSIAVTLHHPPKAVWERFTHFTLLREGRTLYYGSREKAVDYFGHLGLSCPKYRNPSDYFVHVTENADIDQIWKKYQSSVEFQALVVAIDEETNVQLEFDDPVASVSFPQQCFVLTKRSFLNNIRNRCINLVRAIMYFIMSYVAASLYGTRREALSATSVVLFIAHVFMAFLSLAALPFSIHQRAVLIREQTNGLVHPVVYYLSNWLSGLPLLLVGAGISSIVAALVNGFNDTLILSCLLLTILTVAQGILLTLCAGLSYIVPSFGHVVETNIMRAFPAPHRYSFNLGMRFGITLALLAWAIWECIIMDTRLWEYAIIQFYRGVGVLISFVWLWGGTVWVWKSVNIQCEAFFDLNYSLRPVRIWMEGSSMSITYLLNVLLYRRALRDNLELHYYVPLGLYLYVLWKIVFFCKTQPSLQKSLKRVLTAPFSHVAFKDSYLGDVLTSLAHTAVDFAWSTCHFVTGEFKTAAASESACTSSSTFTGVGVALLALPLWWRCCQNVRRFYDTGHRHPHLSNALKYVGGLYVVLTRAFDSYTTFWLTIALLATLYQFWWDIKMDWRLPRARRLYKHTIVYYLATIIDLILRFLWTLPFLLDHFGSSFGKELQLYLSPVFAAAAVFRRCMWSCFRVENEHLVTTRTKARRSKVFAAILPQETNRRLSQRQKHRLNAKDGIMS